MTPEINFGTLKVLSEFDRALITAAHFGFRPIPAPKIGKRDIELARNSSNNPHFDAIERLALMRTYIEDNLSSLAHPLAIVYKRRAAAKNKSYGYFLHFIGSLSGMAEATLIRTTLSILSEEGYKNLELNINCVGDRESIEIYERELRDYVKKMSDKLSAEARELLKNDVFNIFKLNLEEDIPIREQAPTTITFLTSQSRNHFKEVLEYIEALGIEFRLTPDLLGDRTHVSHTIFAVKNQGDTNTLAIGYRFSRLGRFLGLRKEIPMAGVTIFPISREGGRVYKELPKPKFLLVQLGEGAKIKTLSLIEQLRAHRIPVYHFLGRDKLTTQLSSAENLRIPYLMIIGQKEAFDNTVTIRNISTRAQDTVSILNLPAFLKNLTF